MLSPEPPARLKSRIENAQLIWARLLNSLFFASP